MTDKIRIPAYKTVCDKDGIRYRFLCELSEAVVCTTEPYSTVSPEEGALLAWMREGRSHFNHCKRCSRYVSDAMFNVEVLECVACAPFEAEAKYCKSCGARVSDPKSPCPECNNPLVYLGKEFEYESGGQG